MKQVVAYRRDGARFVDKLPEGDWHLATGGGVVIAACPQHPPRSYDSVKTTLEDHAQTGVVVLDMVWMTKGVAWRRPKEILRDATHFVTPREFLA